MMQRATLSPLLLVSAMSLALAACSSDDDESTGGNTGESGDTSSLAPGSEGAPTVSNALDGNFVSDCNLEDDDFPEDGYEIFMLSISGASATGRIIPYTDEQCQTPDPVDPEQTIEFSVAYPGGTSSTPRGEAMHIDVTPESLLFNGQAPSPEEQQGLAAFGAFDTIYDIALIDNATLYLGDTDGDGVGESPETRATTLDENGLAMQ